MMLKVAVLLVILLLTQKEASGDTFEQGTGEVETLGETGDTAWDKPGNSPDFNININNNNNVGHGIDDAIQALAIFKLQEQVKELTSKHAECQKKVEDQSGQVKKLTLELCITKRDCCKETGVCPCGYERFSERPNKCYKFSEHPWPYGKNYTDAKSDCHQVPGGHLFMPKDQATNDFLAKQIKVRYGIRAVWIGLKGQGQGIWVWDDGTTLGSGQWNNWDPVYGTTATSTCASWVRGPTWFDLSSCKKQFLYICEVKAATAP